MTSSSQTPFEPSAGCPLFILAMDHRTSFAKTVFGISGEPTDVELDTMRDAKMVIYEGARRAIDDGLPAGRAGVLVDEHLGSQIARRAKADGVILAMPIEKSGTKLFELEYGLQFDQHVETFDPDFFKVLVRYNPADGEETRAAQIERLAPISAWAKEVGRRWLFELLVPPTSEQLIRSEDQYHFDRDARPGLTAEALTAFMAGDVHPTVWKLEGYETPQGAQEVLRTVASDGDHRTECIVLGRDAPMTRVEHWIDVGAPLPGFAGFAVGRSIWEEPLLDLVGGKSDRDEVVQAIAVRYRALTHAYATARQAHVDKT